MPILNKPTESPRYYAGASGCLLPSVTMVLSVAENRDWMNKVLKEDGRRELDRLRNNAAVLGTKIHKIAENHALGKPQKIDNEFRPYADAIEEFFTLHVRRVIGTEIRMASEKMRFGGTCDLVCELTDGSVAVVDWKSKRLSGVTALNRAQTAGYALLLRESGQEINKRIVVRLHTEEKKQGRWYARVCKDHKEDVKAFLACRDIWWWLHGGRIAKEELRRKAS